MISSDLSRGRFISAGVTLRGNVSPANANKPLFEIKRNGTCKFIPWVLTGL